MAGALEAVDGQEVHAELLRGQRVSDGSALVQDYYVCGFELVDYGAGRVTRGFNCAWLILFEMAAWGLGMSYQS